MSHRLSTIAVCVLFFVAARALLAQTSNPGSILGRIKNATKSTGQPSPAATQAPQGQTAPSGGSPSAKTAQPSPAIAPQSSAAATGPVGGGPSLGEYVPLTTWRMQLLLFRDNPALLTDEAIFPRVLQEISGEASIWKTYDNLSRDPMSKRRIENGRKMFIFEWQKYIDQNPEMARGQLMDVFLRGDADWSFVKSQPGWDENPINVIDVLLFSKEKVVDRDAQFAARELMPVYRKHLELAVSKAATKMVFNVSLPTAYFDFATNSFRFPTQATMAANAKHEFRPKIDVLSPTDPSQPLPPATTSLANYYSGTAENPVRLEGETTPHAPGSYAGAGPNLWRTEMEWKATGSFVAFALDRRLELTGFPVDMAKAEALSKRMPTFSARVYIDAQHIYTLQNTTILQSFLAARVEKMEIVGPDHEAIATLPASGFPGAGHSATPTSSAAAAPASESVAGVWTAGNYSIALGITGGKITGSVTANGGTHRITQGSIGSPSFSFQDDQNHLYNASFTGNELKVREVLNGRVIADRTYVRVKK